jgi:hypothetical protein
MDKRTILYAIASKDFTRGFDRRKEGTRSAEASGEPERRYLKNKRDAEWFPSASRS